MPMALPPMRKPTANTSLGVCTSVPVCNPQQKHVCDVGRAARATTFGVVTVCTRRALGTSLCERTLSS